MKLSTCVLRVAKEEDKNYLRSRSLYVDEEGELEDLEVSGLADY